MGSNPQKALERHRGMPGTQQTIHLGIRLRGAQLHTHLLHPLHVSGYTGACSAHANAIQEAHIQQFNPIHLSLKGVLLACPESPVMPGWTATHSRSVRSGGGQLLSLCLLFTLYFASFPSACRREPVKETQSAKSSRKNCV